VPGRPPDPGRVRRLQVRPRAQQQAGARPARGPRGLGGSDLPHRRARAGGLRLAADGLNLRTFAGAASAGHGGRVSRVPQRPEEVLNSSLLSSSPRLSTDTCLLKAAGMTGIVQTFPGLYATPFPQAAEVGGRGCGRLALFTWA